MRRLLKQFAVAFGVSVAAVLFVGGNAAAQFNANDVADDYIFNNYTSMNAAQIDSFLNSQPSSCISASNGFQAPDPNGYNPTHGFTYGGQTTAGTIISHAAQAYQINPQVLLTTLQKEQSLVTGGGGCSTLGYTGAMGYGCPDSGTTHSYSGLDLYSLHGSEVTSVNGTCVNTAAKAGFTQQVIHGAWLLKFGEERSEGNIGWNVQLTTTKDISGLNWNSTWDNSDDPETCYQGPMAPVNGAQRCPSGPSNNYDGSYTIDNTGITIANGATAALYWYTPHFSGNQHFDTIFQNWFGPTVTSGFNWAYEGQAYYTDSTKTTVADPNNVVPGQRLYLTVSAQNIGTQTWTQNIVNLGTSQPQNRPSAFYDTTWPSWNRAATLDQTTVAPGSTGTFSFWVTVPNQPGVHKEYFDPVADGYSWMNDMGLYWQFNVQPATYTWQYVASNIYTDQTESTVADPTNTVPGQRYYMVLVLKNTGNEAWRPGYVNLGTSQPQNRSSLFHDSTWPSANRAATVPGTVQPGQTTTFTFWVHAPAGLNQGGTYKEYFEPVADGFSWMPDLGAYWQFTVPNAQYSWQYVSSNAYTDQTMNTSQDLTNVSAGQRVYMSLQIKNTGNVAWYPGYINLGTSQPADRSSSFHDTAWPSANRAGTISAVTLPGQTATINFWMKAPATPGTYREYFDPVADGASWFIDYGMNWQFTVH